MTCGEGKVVERPWQLCLSKAKLLSLSKHAWIVCWLTGMLDC